MTGFDFTWFENMYALIASFADTVYNFFFVDNLHSVMWTVLHTGKGAAWFRTGLFERIMSFIPDQIEYLPIGFGLLFGAFGFFAVYTFVKWVLDIVF